jgi:hypothetical protein
VGHNGNGPGYSASAFHALDLGGASVCVLGAIEEGFPAHDLVLATFHELAQDQNPEAGKRQAPGDR